MCIIVLKLRKQNAQARTSALKLVDRGTQLRTVRSSQISARPESSGVMSPHSRTSEIQLVSHTEEVVPAGSNSRADNPLRIVTASAVTQIPAESQAGLQTEMSATQTVAFTTAATDELEPSFTVTAITLTPPKESTKLQPEPLTLAASIEKSLNRNYWNYQVVVALTPRKFDNRVVRIRRKKGAEIPASQKLNESKDQLTLTFAISEIANQGAVELVIEEIETTSKKTVAPTGAPSKFVLDVDTIGPRLANAKLSGDLTKPTKVRLQFVDDDLDETNASLTSNRFQVHRVSDAGTLVNNPPSTATMVNEDVLGTTRKLVELGFDSLEFGTYRISIPDKSNDKANALKDTQGNVAGSVDDLGNAQETILEVFPQQPAGEQVEFPEFLPTAPQPVTQRRLNPADKVETAVVRLYYFRDAHRVAQLVNRSVRP